MARYELSEEERLRRSERARELHSQVVVDEETGLERRKFGGPQPGSGRPRKRRASEVIAERVADDAEALYERLRDIGLEGKAHAAAISAIRELLKVEEQERALAERDEIRWEDMERAELLAFVAGKLEELHEAGIIGSGGDLIGRVVDAEVVRVEDDGPDRAGEGPAGALALEPGERA